MLDSKSTKILKKKNSILFFFLLACHLLQAQSNISSKSENYPKVTEKSSLSSFKNTSIKNEKSRKETIETVALDAQKVIEVGTVRPAEVNIETLPLYGGFEKSKSQLENEKAFIIDCLREFGNKELAHEFFIKMAWQYLEEGDKVTALSRFNLAHVLNPGSVDSFWGLGVIEYQKNEFPSALKLFQRGLELDPKNYVLMVDKATVYLKMAEANPNSEVELNAAKILINKALEIQPNYVNAYHQLSYCHFLSNALQFAWNAFHKSIEINPHELNTELLEKLLSKYSDPKGIFSKKD
jgi:tetratricopeptide (TPR) repeat protein